MQKLIDMFICAINDFPIFKQTGLHQIKTKHKRRENFLSIILLIPLKHNLPQLPEISFIHGSSHITIMVEYWAYRTLTPAIMIHSPLQTWCQPYFFYKLTSLLGHCNHICGTELLYSHIWHSHDVSIRLIIRQSIHELFTTNKCHLIYNLILCICRNQFTNMRKFLNIVSFTFSIMNIQQDNFLC